MSKLFKIRVDLTDEEQIALLKEVKVERDNLAVAEKTLSDAAANVRVVQNKIGTMQHKIENAGYDKPVEVEGVYDWDSKTISYTHEGVQLELIPIPQKEIDANEADDGSPTEEPATEE